jgi:hypothetical protein
LFHPRGQTAAKALLASIAIPLVLSLSACRDFDFPKDSKLSPSGEFVANLGDRETDPLSYDITAVTLEKVHPNWMDTLTLNRNVEVCSLQERGEISIAWTDSNHLMVTCSGCVRGALAWGLEDWDGVSIQYVYKNPRPFLEEQSDMIH